MSSARDRLGKNIPGWLVDSLKDGFGSFAADCYREPRNKGEAQAFRDLMTEGYTVLKRGWPDFMVLTNQDDLFLVEVKDTEDDLRPSQRVMLEALSRKGIDVYVWWKSGSVEVIGESKPISHYVKKWDNDAIGEITYFSNYQVRPAWAAEE